jgi:phosphinothricin acetyltransferase
MLELRLNFGSGELFARFRFRANFHHRFQELMPAVAIRAMQAADFPSVRAIYLDGIATGNATFAETAPDWPEWDAGHLARCRLIAEGGDAILGWAALSPYSARCVYGGVAEVSIYVATSARGKGVGGALLQALIAESEKAGVWTLQAGIFPENTASVQLHKRCGFRVVGTRERLGCMKGRWRDAVLMERRSEIAGLE